MQRASMHMHAWAFLLASAALLALPPARADAALADTCQALAGIVLGDLGEMNDDVVAGCDSPGAADVTACDLDGSAGPCSSNPDCNGVLAITSENCTPELLPRACCGVLKGKPCDTCEPVTRGCVTTCLTERPSPTTSQPSDPPPNGSAFTTDVCDAVADEVLMLLAMEEPDSAATSCADVGAAVACASTGSVGTCAANPSCAAVETVLTSACTSAADDSGCCSVLLGRPCADCDPIPAACLQSCLPADRRTGSTPDPDPPAGIVPDSPAPALPAPPPPTSPPSTTPSPQSTDAMANAICSEVSLEILAALMMDSPGPPVTCADADVGTVCDASGTAATCASSSVCDGIETLIGETCESDDATAPCCSVFRAKLCPSCDPGPLVCYQSCFSLRLSPAPSATRAPPAAPPTDRECAARATAAFDSLVAESPDSYVAGGCDAVDDSTSPAAICEIRGTAGPCKRNPACPADQIERVGCTAANEDDACCYEELAKPCPECSIVPLQCLSLCDGPAPPPRTASELTSAFCADVADAILPQLAVDSPDGFSDDGCDGAEPGTICDIAGVQGLCSGVPECNGVEAIGTAESSDECATAPTACCNVLRVAGADGPQAAACVQTCFPDIDFSNEDGAVAPPSPPAPPAPPTPPAPAGGDVARACRRIASLFLEESAMTNPELYTTAGCDAAEPFAICDIRSSVGACEDNPGCPPAQIDNGQNCTAENLPPVCCFESVSKACEDCEPIPLQCLNFCVGDADIMSLPAEELLDRQCADVADIIASRLAVESPDLFSASCEMAEAQQTCDLRGAAGPCSAVPECAGVSISLSDGCAAEGDDSTCCTTAFAKICPDCNPEPAFCLQSCDAAGASASPVPADGGAVAEGDVASACRSSAAQFLEELAMASPEAYTTMGCDAAAPLTICDIRATAGACEDNAGCPPAQIDDAANCTADNTPPVCCFESVAKACEDCEPIPLQCLNVCVGEAEIMPLPEAEVLDRQCADRADIVASLLAADTPNDFSPNCSVAEPGQVCDIRGSAGACSAVSECASVEVSAGDACAAAGSEPACCSVVFFKGCEECASEPAFCLQSCFAEGMAVDGPGGYGE